MDVIRLVCSFFLIVIVLLLLASYFNTTDLGMTAKITITGSVMFGLVGLVTISDLYIITYNLRSDLEAYMNECNAKVHKKYLENSQT